MFYHHTAKIKNAYKSIHGSSLNFSKTSLPFSHGRGGGLNLDFIISNVLCSIRHKVHRDLFMWMNRPPLCLLHPMDPKIDHDPLDWNPNT